MPQLKLNVFITNDPIYGQNGMVISLRRGGPCWIIDPGLPPQPDEMIEHVREHDLQPLAVVLTHAHADHIAGIDDVREVLGSLPVYLARSEWPALTDPMENLSGLFGPGLATKVTDPRDLAPGDNLDLDGVSWQVFDTSGHSPGGRSLYASSLGVVIVGDALFAGSVGRVDFPHSDGARLMRNIQESLLALPDETRVFSGHGPQTTIGRERRTNPFILHGL